MYHLHAHDHSFKSIGSSSSVCVCLFEKEMNAKNVTISSNRRRRRREKNSVWLDHNSKIKIVFFYTRSLARVLFLRIYRNVNRETERRKKNKNKRKSRWTHKCCTPPHSLTLNSQLECRLRINIIFLGVFCSFARPFHFLRRRFFALRSIFIYLLCFISGN